VPLIDTLPEAPPVGKECHDSEIGIVRIIGGVGVFFHYGVDEADVGERLRHTSNNISKEEIFKSNRSKW